MTEVNLEACKELLPDLIKKYQKELKKAEDDLASLKAQGRQGTVTALRVWRCEQIVKDLSKLVK